MDGEEHKDVLDGEEEDQENVEPTWQNLDKATEQKVRDMFYIFDRDQTSYIDAKSMGTLMRWLRFNPTEEEMIEWKNTYDAQEKGQISLDNILEIVDKKIIEPDTIDEFIEAAKVFDHDNDGKIEVAELRYALSRLGDPLEENYVDDLIAELDKEKTGLVDILEWAKITFK